MIIAPPQDSSRLTQLLRCTVQRSVQYYDPVKGIDSWKAGCFFCIVDDLYGQVFIDITTEKNDLKVCKLCHDLLDHY